MNAPDRSESPSLQAALSRYGVELPGEVVERLDRYCQLLWDWNRKLNLTRHTTYDQFVTRDLLDTSQLAELLSAEEEVLDVGTGGGVPGIVLAILRPDLDMSLCESVGKKATALDAMVRDLELPVAVYHGRAEHVLEDLRFDALVARAVGPLWKLCHWFKDHPASYSRILAVKGPRWTEERGEARHRGELSSFELRVAAEYTTPDTGSRSFILKIWPKIRPEPGL